MRSDHLFEDVFADVAIDGAQRIVKEVDVHAAVNGTCQTDALLLPSTKINTLIVKSLQKIISISSD